MDFAGSRYYRVTRILLMCLGLWPYYTQPMKYVYCTFMFLLLLSNVFFQLSSFFTKEYSIDLLLNVFSISGPTMYYTLKYFAIFTNGNKLKEFIEQVRNDWNSLKEEEELRIIHNRTNVGRYYTVALTIWLYSTLFVFISVFFSPNILNIVMPLNISRQLWHLPTAMEFFIDREKYFELLSTYLFVTVFIGVNTMLSMETFFLMHIQHTCAMFQITSYRIERTVNNSRMKSLFSPEKFNSHKSLVEAIDIHRTAIEFVDSLKSTFSVFHFIAIPIGIASLSVNLYIFCEYIMKEDVGNASILFLYVITHFAYIYFCNYIGQLVIDYSEDVFRKICNTRWYEASLTTQKCLMIITYRSMKTSTLIVCLGLFVPSLEGFATMVSSSLSYFMVLYSVRR